MHGRAHKTNGKVSEQLRDMDLEGKDSPDLYFDAEDHFDQRVKDHLAAQPDMDQIKYIISAKMAEYLNMGKGDADIAMQIRIGNAFLEHRDSLGLETPLPGKFPPLALPVLPSPPDFRSRVAILSFALPLHLLSPFRFCLRLGWGCCSSVWITGNDIWAAIIPHVGGIRDLELKWHGLCTLFGSEGPGLRSFYRHCMPEG